MIDVKNVSSSVFSASRRLSSKSGNSCESAACPSVSQLQPLTEEVVDERLGPGIGQHPATCCSRVAGVLSRPFCADRASSSSGAVRQRKNESREARTRSDKRYAPPARPRGSRSTRKMNLGLTRIRAGPDRAGIENWRRQCGPAGKRLLRPACLRGRHHLDSSPRSVDRIRCAQASSSAVRPRPAHEDSTPARCISTPVGLNGRSGSTSSIAGFQRSRIVSDEQRDVGFEASCVQRVVFSMNATVISRGPALSGTRAVNRPSTWSPVIVGFSLDAAYPCRRRTTQEARAPRTLISS